MPLSASRADTEPTGPKVPGIRRTGDYPAAATSLRRALELFRDIGGRYGQAETLNNLGELLSQSSSSRQARDRHARALAIARAIGAPLEEARALEGIGQSHIHEGNPGDGAAHASPAGRHDSSARARSPEARQATAAVSAAALRPLGDAAARSRLSEPSSTSTAVPRPSRPSTVNQCCRMPAIHVHDDGQMTVRRS